MVEMKTNVSMCVHVTYGVNCNKCGFCVPLYVEYATYVFVAV